MSWKSTIAGGMRRAASQPPLSLLLCRPDVRRSLKTLPGFQKLYGSGWDLIHPFDRMNGTRTSGFIPPEQLTNSAFADALPHCYCGSQPSIVRAALTQLPDLAYFTFIDLGAGKGRPAMVASEFPLREVVGVELSQPLVARARRNVAIYRRRHPDHAPIRIENADAATFRFPAGNLVVFLYNPFGETLIRRVVSNLEQALADERRSLFVIYYNPVFGACFDASPVFRRYHAGTIFYAAEEQGYGPDSADPIVIWQGGSSLPARVGADAPIRVVRPGERSELGHPCCEV
jgi:hypothetical protein